MSSTAVDEVKAMLTVLYQLNKVEMSRHIEKRPISHRLMLLNTPAPSKCTTGLASNARTVTAAIFQQGLLPSYSCFTLPLS